MVRQEGMAFRRRRGETACEGTELRFGMVRALIDHARSQPASGFLSSCFASDSVGLGT